MGLGAQWLWVYKARTPSPFRAAFPRFSTFARPSTQRRPSTSSPHIATRRIKINNLCVHHAPLSNFLLRFSLSFGGHCCEREIHLRPSLTSGLGKRLLAPFITDTPNKPESLVGHRLHSLPQRILQAASVGDTFGCSSPANGTRPPISLSSASQRRRFFPSSHLSHRRNRLSLPQKVVTDFAHHLFTLAHHFPSLHSHSHLLSRNYSR